MFGLLTCTGSSNLSNVSMKETSDQCPVAKYGFWEAVDGVPLIAFPDFEDIEGEDKHHYIALLNDHHKGGVC